jgi:tetratricopeptide (TPR) repeat protein
MNAGTSNAIIWLLKIAASMMLFVTVVIGVGVTVVWLAIGLIDGEWSRIPVWSLLVAALFCFVQLLISSFLYGVSKQAATARGEGLKDLSWGEKLSDTIDDGWAATLTVGKRSLLVICVLLFGTIAVFFNDLKFLIGFHRGMELNVSSNPRAAVPWFQLSLDAAGPDRVAIARFLLAGTLINDQKFAEAEKQLRQCITELDVKNEDHLSLLVYVYSALSNCLMFENNFPEAEKWAAQTVKLIEDNPNLLGLRFRLIGTYKQFLIPQAPPLAVALEGLEDIYIKEGNLELALKTYSRILKQLEKNPKLTDIDVFEELNHFQRQLVPLPSAKTAAADQAAVEMTAKLAEKKCKIIDDQEFENKYRDFIKKLNQLNRVGASVLQKGE